MSVFHYNHKRRCFCIRNDHYYLFSINDWVQFSRNYFWVQFSRNYICKTSFQLPVQIWSRTKLTLYKSINNRGALYYDIVMLDMVIGHFILLSSYTNTYNTMFKCYFRWSNSMLHTLSFLFKDSYTYLNAKSRVVTAIDHSKFCHFYFKILVWGE